MLRYGNEKREVEYYVAKNLAAFPHELTHFEESWSSQEKQYLNCYRTRIIERFLQYLAYVDYGVENRFRPNEKSELSTTIVFRELFELRGEKFQFKRSEYCA